MALARFGVSLDKEILKALDGLNTGKRFSYFRFLC
jgi:hypothetical protein